jgi:hypothetical protein
VRALAPPLPEEHPIGTSRSAPLRHGWLSAQASKYAIAILSFAGQDVVRTSLDVPAVIDGGTVLDDGPVCEAYERALHAVLGYMSHMGCAHSSLRRTGSGAGRRQ